MTGPLSRRAALLGGAAALVSTGAASAQLLSGLRNALPIGGFSVSGKPGTFIKQVASRKMTAGGASGEDALGFSSGQFQAARLSMPQTEAKIGAMLTQLSAGWPYARPPAIKVHMIADGRFGPAALPDGSIAVPVGFLVRATSDDEVAFVLGHEYSHLALGHFARLDRMKSQRAAISKLASVYASGAALTQLRLQQAGQQTSLTIADRQKVQDATDKAARAQDQLDWAVNVLVEPAWGRGQEDEADACGFDLAYAAGYSPIDAAGDAFDQLRADDQARKALVSQLQDQIQESVAAANTVGNRNSLQQGNATAFVTGFAKNLTTGLKDRVLSTTEDFLSAQHRDPEARRKGISDYAQAAYPQQKLADLKMTWLNGARTGAEFTNAKTAVAALQTAQKARYEGRLADAQTAIRQALATSFGSLPLFLNESARIFRDQKDLRNAEAQFTKADASSGQTFDGFRDHVLMCMAQPNYARALQVIDIYAKRAGTDKDFLPQLVRIRFKQGQNDEAVKLLQRCVDYQEPDLRQACAMSAFGPDDAEWDKLPDSTKADITRASGKATTKLSVEGFGDLLKSLQN